jgi:hypothetical protein
VMKRSVRIDDVHAAMRDVFVGRQELHQGVPHRLRAASMAAFDESIPMARA